MARQFVIYLVKTAGILTYIKTRTDTYYLHQGR